MPRVGVRISPPQPILLWRYIVRGFRQNRLLQDILIVIGVMLLVAIFMFLTEHSVHAKDLPSTEVKVNAVNGKHVTVQPFFAPQFVLLAEGNVPDKFEAMTCIPRAKEV